MGYYQVSRPVARRLLLVNSMNGWIKLFRKIQNKGYYKKSPYVHLWIHLLLNANHGSKEFMWNNNIILIKEGQLITGRNKLALETGIKPTSIERILNMLENEHQIGQQKTTKYRLITIVNWKEYQNTDSKTDSKRTTNGQQADTNKNVRIKEGEEDNTSGQSPQLIPNLIKLFETINPTCKTYYRNTTQRKACEFLISTYGFDKVSNIVVGLLPQTNSMEYMPTITTPVQLKDKWSQLEAGVKKERSKIKSKGNVYW